MCFGLQDTTVFSLALAFEVRKIFENHKGIKIKIIWEKILACFWLCKPLVLLIYILINTVDS